jgi:hypothetical protein
MLLIGAAFDTMPERASANRGAVASQDCIGASYVDYAAIGVQHALMHRL